MGSMLLNQVNRLSVVVFVSGAIGMVLELVGSRVLSPFFGNSLFVWTGLIGVILGSLSLGYYLGGKLADKNGNMSSLAKVLMIAGTFILLTAFLKEFVLVNLATVFKEKTELASLIAILILFAPASIALGCVSPLAAKIRIVTTEYAGSVVGNLYALSTLGSITGTFFAGYLLIPGFGNSALLYILAGILFLLSCIASAGIPRISGFLLAMTLLLYYLENGIGFLKLDVLADVDSLYNRILIRKMVYKNKETLTISTEKYGTQSLVFVDSPGELVTEYTNAYRIGNLVTGDINNALMLGGAGFTFPRYFLENNLGKNIDVVEIDGKMVEMARKYFYLKSDTRMNIYLSDARTFVRSTDKKYDIIYVDVFNTISPPYYLATKEFFEDLKKHLTDNGVIMVNIISATRGAKSIFLNAEVSTLRSVYSKIDLFVIQPRNSDQVQNLMLVAYKGERKKELTTQDEMLKKFISERYSLDNQNYSVKVLTDDYSPVDYITSNLYFDN